MSSWVVLTTYCSAAVMALALLYWFEPVRWYWHVLATLLAIGMGLVPIPPEWPKPQSDLMVGWLFSLLFVWGVAAPLFRRFHHQHVHS